MRRGRIRRCLPGSLPFAFRAQRWDCGSNPARMGQSRDDRLHARMRIVEPNHVVRKVLAPEACRNGVGHAGRIPDSILTAGDEENRSMRVFDGDLRIGIAAHAPREADPAKGQPDPFPRPRRLR